MSLKNHYIIVGGTALARNSYQELKQRGLAVRVILQNPGSDCPFDADDVQQGDASDTHALQAAGVDSAAAVLALLGDDSENAFVVLAVKELKVAAKTVAAVNDSKNIGRVKRVQPDMIIAPQVIGGELLAMALNGEVLESQTVLGMFRFVA